MNILAPYILTCLIQKTKRLIYLSSGMHLSGNARPDNLHHVSYSDTKPLTGLFLFDFLFDILTLVAG
ncbi:hypothetical protein SNE25_27910 [Mucilaginibacter sabulilitoris]|uniref:Uncharacterized protein n=1 Tax=Mucilaginibacter sabulilitoris TaxID=1173583 RepID=A0ABZ0TJC6_9SPHI|nr:hypothetical protein [Mucilaginibacter sabulilitoris]WPU93148.1 hypothetical protein SNE25_27910 [Mucilaginibacter sabulilitoris]